MLQLRPHHICCIRFWRTSFTERGPDFLRVENTIKNVLLSQPEEAVVVIEGVDELCQRCTLRVGERCSSPRGNEDEVRKWDAILLKELGLSFGSCLTSGQWQALIEQRIPFKLCHKCQWKQVCRVGTELL